jgi:hypothetical protein
MESATHLALNSTLYFSSMTAVNEISTSQHIDSMTSTISTVAITYVYVSIGVVGFFGNLMVIVILAFFTETADKVCD